MSAELTPRPLKEQFTRGPRCADLPDLGADLLLQPGLCPLSELVGSPGPGRADARRGRGVVDEMVAMKVFYVNIGGGEPMLRPDFFDLVWYAVERRVGVKFSTNGTRLTPRRARAAGGASTTSTCR